MKRINKIILFFLAFSLATLYAGWIFIHSRNFSQHASEKVSDILTKKIGMSLSFEKIDFGMFPPSTVFRNVHLVKKNKGEFGLDLKLSEFGVYFTYASFFSSNLEVDELVANDGELDLKINHDPKDPDIEWKKLNINKLYDDYLNIYSKSPIKINFFKIKNVKTVVDNVQGHIGHLTLMPHKKVIKLKAEFSDLLINEKIKDLEIPKIDKVFGQITIEKDVITVDEINTGFLSSTAKITGVINQKKNRLDPLLRMKVSTNLMDVKKVYTKKIQDLINSDANIVTDIKMFNNFWDPELLTKIQITNLKSPFILFKEGSLIFEKKKNLISLLSGEIKNNNEKYTIVKGAPVFDLEKKWFVKTKGTIALTKAMTNTFLYAIKDSLEPVKGIVDGKIDVGFDGEKVFFNVLDKTEFKDFKLDFKGSKHPLLQNGGFSIKSAVITLDSKNTVAIDANVFMKDSDLKLHGYIDPKNININITNSKINLQSFGPIGGVKIFGSGPVDLKIFGPLDDVRFDFNVEWKDFSVVDLFFGEVKSHFVLSLADVILSIDKLTGQYNQSKFAANGWLKFGDKSGLDLKLDFLESNFSDAKEMYKLVFNGLKIPKDLNMKFSSNYRVYGDYDLDNLKVEGSLKGKEFHVYGEDAETASFNFSLLNRNLVFKNLKIKKSRGEILGNANVSLTNGYAEVEGSGSGLRLSDFNFYNKFKLSYDADLNLEFDGNGTADTFSSRVKFKTIDPFIGNIPASSSSGLVYLNHDDLVVKVNLLGNKVKLDTIFDYNSNLVTLKSIIETQDLKELLGAISTHNVYDHFISGGIKTNINAKFNATTLEVSKIFIDIKQFNLKRDEVDLKIDPNKNTVLVEDGIVKKWDLNFVDGKDFFSSRGYNEQGKKAIICEQVFSIKSNILELFSSFVEKSKGIIRGYNKVRIDNKISFDQFRFSSTGSILKIKNVPGQISDLAYDIVKNDLRFDISKMTAKYGEGDFKANGFLIFDNLYPTMNIEFKLDKSIVPLFKKSNVAINMNGLLSGTDLPYNLNAKVSFIHGEILDELADITNENKLNLDEFNKYLPNKNGIESSGYVNLNINFDTNSPVVVKNNYAELYLKAAGQLTGNFTSPEINTRVDVQPVISKFKFKGHDFILNQGYVEIHDKAKVRNSEIKFIGLTKVNEYEIKLDVTGKLDKVGIALTSEPVKSQEDIISLLALGVTTDMSKNLDASEKAAVARLGIGTMFLDRLNVNEDLNSTIGVNLSVQPEFQTEESSLVSGGKSAVGDTNASKLKSSTKIKVNKKLTNKVEVSVSSTVGGSIEQKQEMNINWNIDKNVSVEGVYEIKPSEDETNTPTSLGADLKFKWSF